MQALIAQVPTLTACQSVHGSGCEGMLEGTSLKQQHSLHHGAGKNLTFSKNCLVPGMNFEPTTLNSSSRTRGFVERNELKGLGKCEKYHVML